MRLTNRTRRLLPLALALLALASSNPARAIIITGFEPGDPVFNQIGDAGFQGTYNSIAPFQLTRQFLLTTISNSGDGFPGESGTNAVPVNTLATFFGIAAAQITFPGSLAREGSGFSISFTATAGQVLSFNYNFLTSEGPNTDYAFYTLTGTTGSVNFANSTQATSGTASGTFALQTNYQTFTIPITTTGTFTFGIGIVDGGSFTGQSGILLDNIQLVPEPTTFALVGLGAVGMLVILRRRRLA
jgi:PEP-CTERM motif